MNASRSIRIHNPEALHAPTGYSHVAEVRGGTLVYIAGQVGFDREGKIAGDFAAQVEQVFSNLGAALKAAGGSFADVVKLNCYCLDSVDRSQLPIFRETRDRYVNTAKPPASTFVFVSALVRPEWLIEVEAIAVVHRAE